MMERSPARRLALLVSLAVAGPSPAARGEEEKLLHGVFGPPGGAFGPPAGTRTDYRARYAMKAGETERVEETSVAVFRTDGKASPEVAISLSGKDPESIPLLFGRLRQEGRVIITEPSRRGESLSFHVPGAIFTSLEAPAWTPGTTWKDAEARWEPFLLGGLLEHRIEEPRGRARMLSISSRKVGDATSFFGRVLGVSTAAWTRELALNEKTGRPLLVRIETDTQVKRGQEVVTFRQSIEIEETAHRPLSEEEAAGLAREIASLREVLRAGEGAGGPSSGLLSRLFARKPASDPLTLLDAHQKSHPEGLLAGAARALRTHLHHRIEEEKLARERKKAAEHLVGANAPDFTLDDLEGKKVSLSGFRGKVVLLTFWGVG